MTKPTPMDATIYGMARQMGRAAAMGFLPRAHADAAMIAAACRAEREGRTECAAPRVVWFAQHLFRQEAERITTRRSVTEYQVAKASRRLMEMNAPVGRIWAEAHNENGAAGFPLTEREVEGVVKAEAATIVRVRQWQARQGLRRAG